jgi:hypothetical protein
MMTQLGWSNGACQEGPDQFREVIKRGEAFLAKYPSSEVSDRIRLEVANAYATWRNVANLEPSGATDPKPYQAGALRAKRRAIGLYAEYLRTENQPEKGIGKRLKALRKIPRVRRLTITFATTTKTETRSLTRPSGWLRPSSSAPPWPPA